MVEKIYNKITMSKKNTIIFILFLTLLSSIPVFIFPGIKKGDDTYCHLSRICALADNIKNQSFLNGIYPGYFNDYGYANGLFYPDIFLYIPAILKAFGLSEIISYKLFIVLINFFSILTIYIIIKGISKSKYASILGIIIYAFASYRLVDIYERGALGESLAFIFAPLIIYGIYEIIYNNPKKYYLLVIGMSGMILSHIVSTYMIGILLVLLCLINIKKILKEKRYIFLLKAALLTLLITSFFLIPMLEQMNSQQFYYSNTSNINEFVLSKRTVPFYLLFLEIPNLRKAIFKKFWIPSGIGIIFIYLIYKKLKNKKINDKFINNSYILGIIFLLITTNLFPWNNNIIKKIFYPIQFPWRFYFLSTILLTISGSILISKINENKKTIRNIFLISFISLISMFVISIIPKRLKEVVEYDASYAEYLPKEINKDFIKTRGNIIISNNKTNHKFTKNGTNMEIIFYQENKDTYFELPLIYYKGYKATLNNNSLETFKTENGLLAVKVNNIKSGKIIIKYEGTKINKICKIISLISTSIFIITLPRKKRGDNDEK